MSESTQKVSLSFTKKIEKKSLQISALGNEKSQNLEEKIKHSIVSFDKDTKLPESKKDEMIIPLVESKRDTIFKMLLQKSKEAKKELPPKEEVKEPVRELTLDEQAAEALIKESSQKLDLSESLHPNNNLSIDVNSSNDMNVDLAHDTGKISTLEEYDEVNVEHFGSALLRGMGWRKDLGVGKKNKQVIEIVTPTTKAFALTSTEGKSKEGGGDVAQEEEDEELKKGSLVLIHSGRNRGTYGVVESIDEDHLLVRPSRGEKTVREVEQNVRVVSAKEYKDLSRVINKEMYNQFKAAEQKKKEKGKDSKKRKNKGKEEEREKEIVKSDKKRKMERIHETKYESRRNEGEERERDKNYDSERDRKSYAVKGEERFEREGYGREIKENKDYRKRENEDYKMKEKEENKKREKEDYKMKEKREKDEPKKGEMEVYKKSEKESRRREMENNRNREKEDYRKSEKREKSSNIVTKQKCTMPVMPWATENLRVRIIDKEYKGGKYHKQKVKVSSVETFENCTCVSDEGKMLYDVNPNHLETVIPKTQSGTVFVVKGNHKGERGRVLELDKEKEKATIQLLHGSSSIVKLYYDDICEYVSR